MADLRETKVNISLTEYTALVSKANDLDKIKRVAENCKDNYFGTTEAALIKALCGVWKGED